MLFLQSVKYAIKLAGGVFSGYDGLQTKANDEWEYVEVTNTNTRKWDGSYRGSVEFALNDNPFYVCVAWRNNTHTPLPILLDADSEYPVQNTVVSFFHWLWAKTPFCPHGFQDAIVDCAYYEQQWHNE